MIKVVDNELLLQKLESPFVPEKCFTKNIRESYERFLTTGMDKLLEDASELLSTRFENDIKLVRTKKEYNRRQVWRDGNEAIALEKRIYVDIYLNGELMDEGIDFEFLRVPGMSEHGIFLINGKRKVLMNQMDTRESITHDSRKSRKDNTLRISFPKLAMMVKPQDKDIKLMLSKDSKKSLIDICRYAVNKSIGQDALRYLLASHRLFKMLSSNRKTINTVEGDLDKNKIFERLQGSFYRLGDLRKVFNDTFTLDRAVGYELENDVKAGGTVYKRGEVITPKTVVALNNNMINAVNIRYCPSIVGLRLAKVVQIERLPKGTTVTEMLREEFGVPEDEYVTTQEYLGMLEIDADTAITEEILESLYYSGIKGVEVRVADRSYFSPFYRTIFAAPVVYEKVQTENGTKIVPKSYDPLTIDGSRTLTEQSDTLTTADLLCILSYTLDYLDGLVTPPDVDVDFMKRIVTADEILRKQYMRALEGMQRATAAKVRSELRETMSISKLLSLLQQASIHFMESLTREDNLFSDVEDLNPVSLVSQVNRVITVGKEASDKQRIVPMMYYGKIDPYETSAGKRIGLNNSLCCSVKLNEHGVSSTPYIRIGGTGNKRRLSNKVEWLTQDDEAKVRIAELSRLQFNADGTIRDEAFTLARVPSVEEGERQHIENIPISAVEYVNADPHQHCGSTIQLIPCAGGNDAARNTFSLNLMRQSIQLQNPDIPNVLTPMYRDIFENTDEYVVRYEFDEPGYVLKIRHGYIDVQLDSGEQDTINIQEYRISSQCFVLLNIHVKPGDRLIKGDLVADCNMSKEGTLSMGVNAFVAYMPFRGKNYEDAIPVSESLASRLTSFSVESEKELLPANVIVDTHISRMKFIKPGDVITSYKDSRGVETEVKMRGLRAGLLLDIYQKEGDDVLTTKTLAFNMLKDGDKLAGRHGDKGIESKQFKDSEVPQFANGITVDIMRSPCGTVSRMNIAQQLEAALGFISYLLGHRINTPAFNGASQKEVTQLMNMCYDFANIPYDEAKVKWKDVVPPIVFEWIKERYDVFQMWKGCFNPYGEARLFNPSTGKWYENEITIGVIQILKIEHEVNHKMHARAGVLNSAYTSMHEQPTKGSAKGGGQSTGEMEAAVIAAHGAASFLDEAFNELSDNVQARMDLGCELVGRSPFFGGDKKKYYPKSIENLSGYLYALGVELQKDGEPLFDEQYVEDALAIDTGIFELDEEAFESTTGFEEGSLGVTMEDLFDGNLN